MGVGGINADMDTQEFRKAMAAPATLPEFAGSSLVMDRRLWRSVTVTILSVSCFSSAANGGGEGGARE